MSDNSKTRAAIVKKLRASIRVKKNLGVVKFTLRLPRPLWEALNLAALKQNFSMQQIIVSLVDLYAEQFFEHRKKERQTKTKGGN